MNTGTIITIATAIVGPIIGAIAGVLVKDAHESHKEKNLTTNSLTSFFTLRLATWQTYQKANQSTRK